MKDACLTFKSNHKNYNFGGAPTGGDPGPWPPGPPL